MIALKKELSKKKKIFLKKYLQFILFFDTSIHHLGGVAQLG